MKLADSKLWKFVRNNKVLFLLYKSTVSKVLRKIRMKKRSDDIRRNGTNILMEIVHQLEKTSCVFFADCGTLLGFIRNGKFIKWDYDIDFGIYIKNEFGWSDLEREMKKIGFTLHHQFLYQEMITEQTYKKGNTMIDFFGHFDCGDNTCYYSYYHRDDYKYSSDNEMHVLMFETVKITGTRKLNLEKGYVYVPIEAEDYLAGLYGSSWRVPDPNWKGGSGPACKHLDDDCKARYELVAED